MKTFDERQNCVNEKLENMKQRRKRNRILTGTCMSMAVVILALVLFVPYSTTPPSVQKYSDSPYYALIQKINLLTYDQPRYNNNFEALIASVGFFKYAPNDFGSSNTGAALGGMDVEPMPDIEESNNDAYVEITDNQVAGVTEADLVKRSDKYIYYLSNEFLSVFSIDKENSQYVGGINVVEAILPNGEDWHWAAGNVEMYLSTDCTTVTVIMDFYEKTRFDSAVLLVNLDVTNPANIRLIDHVFFNGSSISTRMVDGDILLTYNYRVYSNDVDFAVPETFVPTFGKPDDMQCISPSDIICPENAAAARYTVICKLDGKTLTVEDSAALLSYSQDLYVSADTLYATYTYTDNSEKTDSGSISKTVTAITGISYTGDTLEKLGTVILEGSIKDQYSMDQYEGILRVVTSTNARTVLQYSYDGNSMVSVDLTSRSQNVNLYCVDLSDWAVVASVIGFAPEGEEATSVRFDGNAAYVCTAEVIQFTDPVYFFDLSDLNHITWTDTGTIDGYSSSLIQLGDGFLLGIGYGDDWQLKIEVYEQMGEKVVSVDKWEAYADFSTEYKSYLVNRDQDLIGLAIWEYGQGINDYKYVLLQFNGYKLQEIASLPLEYLRNLNSVRGILIEDYLYILSWHDSIQVEKVFGATIPEKNPEKP